MKKIIAFFVFSLFVYSLQANKVDVYTAKTVAENFYKIWHISNQQKSSLNVTLAYECQSSTNNQKSADIVSYFYVFNVSDNNGFIIVSGDDIFSPILAYTTSHHFNKDSLPINVKKWLEGYKVEMDYALKHSFQSVSEIEKEWEMLTTGSYAEQLQATTAVSPLVKTAWDQSPYYNTLCPYNSSTNERTVTGCVATAMAQIMKYWSYPTQGVGFHSYVHDTYGTLSANFASTTYNWSSMPNKVTSSNTAVATLMYHCGVSVEMMYGTASEGGSGAYTYLDDYYISQGYIDSRTALKRYFGYTNAAGYSRDDYTLPSWISKLKTELDAGCPILYAGSGTGGGHAFVCDGYDNNDRFHMNWGWSGYYDGYFVISALNPAGTGTGGGTGGFNSNQRAVMGIKPPSVNPNADIRLYSNLQLSTNNEIYYGQPFILAVDIGNFGNSSFNGDIAAFVFDDKYNFVCGIDTETVSISGGYYREMSFSTDGLLQLTPGTYYIAIFYSPSQGSWSMVDNGSYTNLKILKVINPADIEMYSDFVITPSADQIYQGKGISVNCDVLNEGSGSFIGNIYLGLYHIETGKLALLVDYQEITDLPSGYHFKNGLDFTNDKLEVEPGSYLLVLLFQPNNASSAFLVGSSYYQNPIVVVVKANPLQADIYEPNNDHQSAYKLNVKFNQDKALLQTTGSNIHVGNDKDYYKIVLPEGYDYKFKAEVYDAYNFPKNQSYTCDVLFSYFTAKTDWSDAIDDKMNDSVLVENGGTVYFYVSPYSEGLTGTYQLNVAIRRISTSSINQIDNEPFLTVYPNPANDILYIHAENTIESVKIYDRVGKEVMHSKVNNLQTSLHINHFPSGVYFIHIQTDKKTIARKFIKN